MSKFLEVTYKGKPICILRDKITAFAQSYGSDDLRCVYTNDISNGIYVDQTMGEIKALLEGEEDPKVDKADNDWRRFDTFEEFEQWASGKQTIWQTNGLEKTCMGSYEGHHVMLAGHWFAHHDGIVNLSRWSSNLMFRNGEEE